MENGVMCSSPANWQRICCCIETINCRQFFRMARMEMD